MALTKLDRRLRIKRRIRKVVKGTAERPRMSVFRSNKEIYAQLIDDNTGKTLLAASSLEKVVVSSKGTKVEKSAIVGKLLAEKALAAGIDNVAFDRNGYLYHGRVKSIADGAREGGLKF
ncbi:MAG: 50S ribosomal protein L18 [Bacteroidetes bacterium]|nr:MAG: 50S ribosomal protein L18 [Bacteroidota bacterium]MBL1145967.1 50S ribosomal protein L18 [Bacteroidota bacterium]NOG58761.1 50S ribosomal protein L18 [Bacteroidota bacterium]